MPTLHVYDCLTDARRRNYLHWKNSSLFGLHLLAWRRNFGFFLLDINAFVRTSLLLLLRHIRWQSSRGRCWRRETSGYTSVFIFGLEWLCSRSPGLSGSDGSATSRIARALSRGDDVEVIAFLDFSESLDDGVRFSSGLCCIGSNIDLSVRVSI